MGKVKDTLLGLTLLALVLTGPAAVAGQVAIGIELEGCDWQPFDERQYLCLASLARLLMATWPAIGAHRLVGHSDIAPGRKTDPGPHFDWHKLRCLL